MANVKKPKFIGFSTYNRSGPPFTLTDVELIKQDLLNHFLTRQGERVMRPEYGSVTHRLLYEPFDDITVTEIREDAIRIISSEPRVKLVNIEITEADNGISLAIDLDFLPSFSTERLFVLFEKDNNEGI